MPILFLHDDWSIIYDGRAHAAEDVLMILLSKSCALELPMLFEYVTIFNVTIEYDRAVGLMFNLEVR